MGHPVVHWEIAAKDSKALQDFYSKLFDWRIEGDNPMNYGFVDTGGQGGINGGITATQGNSPPYVTFYVQVEDLQAYLNKAEGLGGKTVVPPTPIPSIGSFAVFLDPDGNLIGLFSE